ncbi:MAG: GNAT family N-acetyltransferase [Candidatus Kapabacteria bacterium]|nr:GNAT family N-acetyltransferase [Ignavibacteriota bacterium]MCW5883840.1 GNAT family N-acetyltransferase [Candidatus Kapabacteria bacterium]
MKYILNNTENSDDILQNVSMIFENGKLSSKEDASYFLDFTSKPQFLNGLTSDEKRLEWAELCFKIIRKFNYKLLDLLTSRTNELQDRILFRDMSIGKPGKWTYKKIHHYTKELAASFYDVCEEGDIPRVAILCENSVVSASCDLACLSYDIFVTPLNVSFDRDIIEYIFDTLDINIVISDSKSRLDLLLSIKESSGRDLKIFSTKNDFLEYGNDIFYLGEYETKFSTGEIDKILQKRQILDVNQVCTVMFTSGSTGMPKGISFTMYNLITKRYARGAAVPEVGNDEVMLCYLPLYHTFGRFLELMGSIYWRGTYTFAGNTSSDTLLGLFPKVNPTVFISIPLRWLQLYESAVELMNSAKDSNEIREIFRSVVGTRLKWGLSAAGYLDPKVFNFFSKNDVELCSGFGMTEATGGITMTPPYGYKTGTVGKPLPGVFIRIDNEGVLEISGHYVARYLETASPYSHIPYPDQAEDFISTGDVFKEDEEGYYEIVDRVKDIYKNNRGQTVSPKNVENKFEGVPGIKRTFLVGDGKPYNTLFIVPDRSEEIIMSKPENEISDYLKQIILTANTELIPYERIINFTILERDFELERGELTPKGSYNRKNILANFNNDIEKLYEKNHIDIKFDTFVIRIPRWFFRDLGILETDISADNHGLINHRSGRKLTIKFVEESKVQIGDLYYELSGNLINLGAFSRQPLLWTGNPSLFLFAPVMEGWDAQIEGISDNVFLPYTPASEDYPNIEISDNFKISYNFRIINTFFCDTYFGDIEKAEYALSEIERRLESGSEKMIQLLRKRLQTLARHPAEEIRAEAYRILLLDEPSPDYSKAFPAFVRSGLSYLTENSIKKIAAGKLEIRRLEALRKRLLAYRTGVEITNDEFMITQFKNLFRLLYNFLKHNPDYYTSVRYELISWMLYDKIPEIQEIAEDYFHKIHEFYEQMLDSTTLKFPAELWNSKLVFDDGISKNEEEVLRSVIINRGFLKQSVMLCFDEQDFVIDNAKDGGVWISPLNSYSHTLHYRIVIVLKNNRRFDLQIFINKSANENEILQTILRHVAISGYPFGYRVLPKLGAYREELRAWSFEYFGELSLWAKIREFSGRRITGSYFDKGLSLRKYYISAMSALFVGWRNSGKSILPGIMSPENVIIPELDFRDGAIINSINDWKEYKSPVSIISPLIRNFYVKPALHYPWIESFLDYRWIFEACHEAIGIEETKIFLTQLRPELENFESGSDLLLKKLNEYLNEINTYYFPPLRISNAIERYDDWFSLNKEATVQAKEQTIRELISLYNINVKSEPERFYLYLHTYFKNASKEVKDKILLIIHRLYRNSDEYATHLIETTDLQNLIENTDDRLIFSRMLFPKSEAVDFKLAKPVYSDTSAPVVKTFIKDQAGEIYTFREAESASEVGNLYRIFFKEKYPKVISENDEYIVLFDSIDRIVGGICYRKTDKNSVLIDGSVVISALSNRGLGSAMLEDFCGRMASHGFDSVKAHFFLKNFYLKRGFVVDRRHGTLVRFLDSNNSNLIKGSYCII